MLVVSRQKINPRNVVSRHQPLNLIQNCHRIEGRHLRLKVMSLKPDRMPVASPDCAPRVCPMSERVSATKRNQLCTSKPIASAMRTIISKSGLHIRLLRRPSSPICRSPQVFVHGPGLFVSIRGRQHNIGNASRFRSGTCPERPQSSSKAQTDQHLAVPLGSSRRHTMPSAFPPWLDPIISGRFKPLSAGSCRPIPFETGRARPPVRIPAAIGIETHLARAARICIIAEADQLRALSARPKSTSSSNPRREVPNQMR